MGSLVSKERQVATMAMQNVSVYSVHYCETPVHVLTMDTLDAAVLQQLKRPYITVMPGSCANHHTSGTQLCLVEQCLLISPAALAFGAFGLSTPAAVGLFTPAPFGCFTLAALGFFTPVGFFGLDAVFFLAPRGQHTGNSFNERQR